MTETNKITIITGKKGEGKTQLVQKLVRAMNAANLQVAGLLSPAVFAHGKKMSIDVKAIHSGEVRQLAVWDPGWDATMPIREWRFDPKTLAWGNDLLGQLPLGYDVLVLDELGYLELEKNQGWVSSFDLIDGGSFLRAYIVVRQSLLPLASKKWAGYHTVKRRDIHSIHDWIDREVTSLLNCKEAHIDPPQKRQ